MRFKRLSIPAFGPFTDYNLALPVSDHDLHVIYGDNEAGKSSLLRAIRDLLFGISGTSSDNFRHEYKNLRIKGEIENQKGDRLTFQRRKGNKDTLLSETGEALQDSALQPFLGGIDRGYFSAMFGLGGRELHEGAEDLLKGEGEIGKALFSASLGGTPIQRVLDSLMKEADGLFKGRSTANISIRQALKDYKEYAKKSRDANVTPEKWDEMEKQLEQKSDAKQELEKVLSNITKELDWIQRCEDSLPNVARLTDTVAELSQLPCAPDVANDFVERAKAARSETAFCNNKLEELQRRVSGLEESLSGCATSPAIMAVEDALDLLHKDLGVYLERTKALSQLFIEVTGIEPGLAAGMKSLGLSGDFDSVETLRLSKADELSLEEAATALLNEQKSYKEKKAEGERLKREIDDDEEELSRLPETNLEPLRAALAEAAEAKEAARTLATSQTTMHRLSEAVMAERAMVAGVPADLEQALHLVVPSKVTIRRFVEEFSSLERKLQSEGETVTREKVDLQGLKDALGRLERRGELPSEDRLKRARDYRDRGWRLVLAEWKGHGEEEVLNPDLPLEEAFPSAIVDADKIADQLRQDADAVAQAEEKRLQIKNCEVRISDAEAASSLLQNNLSEHQAAWESEWAASGVIVRTPVEMEDWYDKWIQLRQNIIRLSDVATDVKAKDSQVQHACETLARALQDSSGKPFSVLYDAALKQVQAGEESAGERKAIRKRLEATQKKYANFHQELGHQQAAVTVATNNWEARCVSAGLTAETTPSTGLKLLQQRQCLLTDFETWRKATDKAAKLNQQVQQYEQRVSEYAAMLGVQAGMTEIQEATLWKSLVNARSAQVRHEHLESQIEDARTELNNAAAAARNAQEAMDQLMQVASVGNAEGLERLLANLERRRLLQEREDGLREALRGPARGQALNDFISRIQAENEDTLIQRKANLVDQKNQNIAELEIIQKSLRELEGQRGALEKASDDAAGFRQQAESEAAAMRQDAARFIRLQMAADLLRKQIERFRKENQGPLLERSEEVFRQMTGNVFDGLAVDFDEKDQPVMVGRRADGSIVGVEGMSDGCRDQLYLSLRLAAMTRYLEAKEPMPLILDDLLITFDNARSRAVLSQLASLARRTQILLFTHHEHLVELCRETLGEGTFTLHKLGAHHHSGGARANPSV